MLILNEIFLLEIQNVFYEEKFFQNGVSSELSENLKRKTINIYSVNCKAFQRYLEYLNVDLAVSFGVGLIKDYIFKTPRHGIINMHRGISESYRGMESDLWAIYNRDFENLGVTIHFVDETLDGGQIILQGIFEINKRYSKSELEDITHKIEHKIYPIAIQWFAEGLITFDNGEFRFKDKVIESPITYLMKNESL